MTIEETLRNSLKDGTLPCAVAFRIAQEHSVAPGEVGDLATGLDIRISHCQLGLFGYGPKAQGLHKIVRPAETVSEEVEKALRNRTADGNITCSDAWAIAKKMRIPKMEVAAAIEALGLRLIQCQLHCF